jgi:hypothetical protein
MFSSYALVLGCFKKMESHQLCSVTAQLRGTKSEWKYRYFCGANKYMMALWHKAAP